MERLGQEHVDGHVDWVNAIALFDDGAAVITGGNDGTLRRWSADDGRSTGSGGRVARCGAAG
jgi:WD40 repeat protein